MKTRRITTGTARRDGGRCGVCSHPIYTGQPVARVGRRGQLAHSRCLVNSQYKPAEVTVRPDEAGTYRVHCRCGRTHAYTQPGPKAPSCGVRFELVPGHLAGGSDGTTGAPS